MTNIRMQNEIGVAILHGQNRKKKNTNGAKR